MVTVVQSDRSPIAVMTTVFFSGSSKLSTDPTSPYYVSEEAFQVFDEIIETVKYAGSDVFIGDAPGFDTIFQDYLKKQGVRYVIVCHGEDDMTPRYKADPDWEDRWCGSRTTKDQYMRDMADVSYGVCIPCGAHVTRANIDYALSNHKLGFLYAFKDGKISFLKQYRSYLQNREGRVSGV